MSGEHMVDTRIQQGRVFQGISSVALASGEYRMVRAPAKGNVFWFHMRGGNQLLISKDFDGARRYSILNGEHVTWPVAAEKGDVLFYASTNVGADELEISVFA